jgi:ribosomal protein L27
VGWEELMDKARAAAGRLVDQGEIVITQRGKIVDPAQVKGPIRLKIR